ncbi:tim10/DDP family zinc finger domain-containing protein [Sarocladium implicatum]|nr:tim10/DDP family zinc finger domain-containing protein [Sarocladium implicatum]
MESFGLTQVLFNRLTQAEQRTLEQRMQKRQVKEFMSAYGGLVEHCFDSCINDFTSKALSTGENGCVSRCVQKWMLTQQRVSDRFQEHNAQLSQQQQQGR